MSIFRMSSEGNNHAGNFGSIVGDHIKDFPTIELEKKDLDLSLFDADGK